jgi:hypothetical protein
MSPEDEIAIAKLIGKRFIARTDAKAEQLADGAYNKLDVPWTLDDILDHIRGHKTYGHYLGTPDKQMTKLCAYDLDVVKEPVTIKGHLCESPRDAIQDPRDPNHYEIMKQLKFMADGLAVRLERVASAADIPMSVAIAFSGAKGVHVYGWFDEPVPVKTARYLAKMTLERFQCFKPKRGEISWQHVEHYEAIEIEVFPKQDKVNATGYGNLMRLPLGRNRKTGGRGFFMRTTPHNSNDFLFAPMDPIEALRGGSL